MGPDGWLRTAQVLKVFQEYVKHYTGLPCRLTLTQEQASRSGVPAGNEAMAL